MSQEMQPSEDDQTFEPLGYSAAEPLSSPHGDIRNPTAHNLPIPAKSASERVARHQGSLVQPRRQEIEEQILAQAARDDRLWTYVAISLVSLGVLLILLGVGVVFVSHNILLTGLSEASGVITEALSTLVLKSKKEARERADAMLDKIDRKEHLEFLRYLIETSSGEIQKRAMEVYIEQIASPQTNQQQTQQNDRRRRKKRDQSTNP